ncbi:MAG: methyltransferase domain-containing protein [Deltaproteobacteria bacterium]|nr:methyltransferase domain-containing protein [Deltaproteobacteria bacterium]
MTASAATHYDRVTEAWRRWVMGEELHFGLFRYADASLAEATQELTVHLAELAQLQVGLQVLDVGCGVGTPGCDLAEHEDCRVLGISTSPVGVAAAQAQAQRRGLTAKVEFQVRDAVATGLTDDTFDRIYSLESAHLMDKVGLFAEMYRVLRPGGRLSLCDVCLVGNEGVELSSYALLGFPNVAALELRRAVHATMHRAFGSAVLSHTRVYQEAALAAGFQEITLYDLSEVTRPTLSRWAENAARHRGDLEEALGPDYVEGFFLALLHMSYGWGRLGGYLAMTATKPA